MRGDSRSGESPAAAGSTSGFAERRPNLMSVYAAKPARITKITAVIASTTSDRSRIANAGVETGAKMLGVWTGVIGSPRPRAQFRGTSRASPATQRRRFKRAEPQER